MKKVTVILFALGMLLGIQTTASAKLTYQLDNEWRQIISVHDEILAQKEGQSHILRITFEHRVKRNLVQQFIIHMQEINPNNNFRPGVRLHHSYAGGYPIYTRLELQGARGTKLLTFPFDQDSEIKYNSLRRTISDY